MNKVSIVTFHGTAFDFDAFDSKYIGQGADTEPNNRLGMYLTPNPTEALDYATSASQQDESVAKVYAVLFNGRLGPSFFSPMDQFVEGDLHDSMDCHQISDAFKQAHENAMKEDEDYDPCEVFAKLRTQMGQSFDALWIENGETPHLVILNPECLRITHKLSNTDVEKLEDIIYESELNPFGEEDVLSDAMAILNRICEVQLKDHRFVLDEVYRLHENQMDFEEGDLVHRLDRFNYYSVDKIDISKIDLDEFSLDEDKINEFMEMYKSSNTYPRIVFDDIDGSIIDGLHRANALSRLGITHINAYIGLKVHQDLNWQREEIDDDEDDEDDERDVERS